MDNGLTPLVHNPTVAYRLDPGEPGVANPARAAASAYTVVGQESRNRARLKAAALQEGQDVLLLKTEYKVRKVGSFLVPVGGLTTIVTREAPQSQATQPERDEARPQNEAIQPVSDRRVLELEAEQQRLETAKRRLEREVGEVDEGDVYEQAQAEFRLRAVESQLEEVLKELRQFRVAQGPADVQYGVRGLKETLEPAAQLLDILV